METDDGREIYRGRNEICEKKFDEYVEIYVLIKVIVGWRRLLDEVQSNSEKFGFGFQRFINMFILL